MLFPDPHISMLSPVLHGGINYREIQKLGFAPGDILDFSVNTNPFGPPPGILASLEGVSIERYPDSDSSDLRQLLAEKLAITSENLLAGSGSTELIRLVAAAYFGKGDRVLIPQPAYGEYEMACRLVGAEVVRLKLLEENGFRLSLSAMEKALREHQPRGVFLCNPHNPTGQLLTDEDIEKILSLCPDRLVVLDEAYISFAGASGSSLEFVNRYNLVIIRSLTKDYALAGLRLGYLVASSPVVEVLNRIKSPWNVSSFAQAAGLQALKNTDYLETCAARLREASQFLIAGLRRSGWQPLPSQANFFLVKVGNASALARDLLSRGILVRDCASFGLPQYIRLSPRSVPECRRLLDVINELGVDRYAC
jgi:histidinol-phosphate aminotransferase